MWDHNFVNMSLIIIWCEILLLTIHCAISVLVSEGKNCIQHTQSADEASK